MLTAQARAVAFGLLTGVFVLPFVVGLVVAQRRRGIATAYTRKTFHVLVFSAVAAVRVTLGVAGVVGLALIVVGAVTAAVLRQDRSRLFDALARDKDRPQRGRFVWVPMVATGLGGIVAELGFGPWAAVGYLVCGWADALAEPVGARWGRRRYRVPGAFGVSADRTVEGSAAVFGASVLAVLVWGTVLVGLPFAVVALPALVIGLASVAVEAASPHGFDNFTLQVAASAVGRALLPL